MPLPEGLLQQLATNSTPPNLSLRKTGVTDDDLLELAPYLRKNTSLKELDLSSNAFTDRGLAALTEALSQNYSLGHLSIGGNPQLTNESAKALAEMIRQHSPLVFIDFSGTNNIDADGYNLLLDAIIQSVPCNLIGMHISNDLNGSNRHWELGDAVNGNQSYAMSLMQTVLADQRSTDWGTVSTDTLYRLYAIAPLILSMSSQNSADAPYPSLDELGFPQFLQDAIKEIHSSGPIVPEEFVTPSANGFALLDIPSITHQLPTYLEALNQRGTPLTLEQLMQPNRDGSTHLESVLRYGYTPSIVPLLNAGGVRIGKAALLDDVGAPTPVLDAAIANGQQAINHLFSYANWQGSRPEDFTQAVQALPQDIQSEIPHKRALAIKLRQDQLAASPQSGRA